MYTNFSPFPVLTSERLILRKVELSDDKEIFFHRSDKAMNQYVDRPCAETIEDAREWIRKIDGFAANNASIFWGIALKDSEPLIGGFCFWNLSRENDLAEIGFSLHPEHWGKGLMQEALTAALQYGVEVMQLKTIASYTNPENVNAIKLLKRNGFELKDGHGQSDSPNYIIFTLRAEDMP